MARPPSRRPADIADDSAESGTEVAKIEDAFERVLEGKVRQKDLPEVARRLTQIAVSEHFSGPMPHPKHLREYESILPGAADRILSMAERNLDHHVDMSKQAHADEAQDRRRGMRYGAVLYGLLIAAAFASLFVTTNAIVPGLFLGTAAIGGVVAFIRGRNGN